VKGRKPVLLYYKILRWRECNIKQLHRCFDVVVLDDPRQDTDALLSRVEILLAPLGFMCDKEKMDRMPRLKIIASNTTGHPHINVEYATSRKIKVLTLKDDQVFLSRITPTAELTWGLIIAVTRNLIPAAKSVLEGRWDRRPYGGRAMLSRMSLGLIGYGRLGKLVGSYGRSFGMTVRYYDPFVDGKDPGIERIENLENLLRLSDVVSLHVPHEPETENLLNRHMFNFFKKGGYLINTSRAELVDEDALIDALERNILAGAAVDVLAGEFDPDFSQHVAASKLVAFARRNDRLLITPHIGGSTKDAWELTERRTIDRVCDELGIGSQCE